MLTPCNQYTFIDCTLAHDLRKLRAGKGITMNHRIYIYGVLSLLVTFFFEVSAQAYPACTITESGVGPDGSTTGTRENHYWVIDFEECTCIAASYINSIGTSQAFTVKKYAEAFPRTESLTTFNFYYSYRASYRAPPQVGNQNSEELDRYPNSFSAAFEQRLRHWQKIEEMDYREHEALTEKYHSYNVLVIDDDDRPWVGPPLGLRTKPVDVLGLNDDQTEITFHTIPGKKLRLAREEELVEHREMVATLRLRLHYYRILTRPPEEQLRCILLRAHL